MPRAGPVHEESVLRVLHATRASTVARMPPSSISECEITPAGLGKSAGTACGGDGSAGSRGRWRCGEQNKAPGANNATKASAGQSKFAHKKPCDATLTRVSSGAYRLWLFSITCDVFRSSECVE